MNLGLLWYGLIREKYSLYKILHKKLNIAFFYHFLSLNMLFYFCRPSLYIDWPLEIGRKYHTLTFPFSIYLTHFFRRLKGTCYQRLRITYKDVVISWESCYHENGSYYYNSYMNQSRYCSGILYNIGWLSMRSYLYIFPNNTNKK